MANLTCLKTSADAVRSSKFLHASAAVLRTMDDPVGRAPQLEWAEQDKSQLLEPTASADVKNTGFKIWAGRNHILQRRIPSGRYAQGS